MCKAKANAGQMLGRVYGYGQGRVGCRARAELGP